MSGIIRISGIFRAFAGHLVQKNETKHAVDAAENPGSSGIQGIIDRKTSFLRRADNGKHWWIERKVLREGRAGESPVHTQGPLPPGLGQSMAITRNSGMEKMDQNRLLGRRTQGVRVVARSGDPLSTTTATDGLMVESNEGPKCRALV